jgi:hypothetical protein
MWVCCGILVGSRISTRMYKDFDGDVYCIIANYLGSCHWVHVDKIGKQTFRTMGQSAHKDECYETKWISGQAEYELSHYKTLLPSNSRKSSQSVCARDQI